MFKVLITGINGFVAKHLVDHLILKIPKVEIIGISRNSDYRHSISLITNYYSIDMNQQESLIHVLLKEKPNYIIHLASQSSVSDSWLSPQYSYSNNTNIFLNLLESIRKSNIKVRLLSVGSSEQYGIVDQSNLPINESLKLNPISPYAVARVSQEMLCQVYVQGFGLDIVMTRSFNHIGPGQSDKFVVSSFAKQLVEMKYNNNKQSIEVGDLNITRDFLDVRDVVEAYILLLEYGETGSIYNICSGNGYALHDILNLIKDQLLLCTKVTIDESRIRPNDNPIIVGDNNKLKDLTGWSAQYNLERTISDIIQFWSSKYGV